MLNLTPTGRNIYEEERKKLEAQKLLEEERRANEYTAQRAAAVAGKHAASGLIGAIPDTLALAYNLPAMGYNALAPEEYQAPLIPSATEGLSHLADEITGGYTKTPKKGSLKNFAKGIEFASSLATPGGMLKVPKLLKAMVTGTKSDKAAAAAAGYTASALEEEGAPASILGSFAAGLATKKGLKKAKNLKNWGEVKIPSKEIQLKHELLAPVLGEGGNPNADLLKAAAAEGIDLPYNIALDSPTSKYTTNILLNTFLKSPKYTKKIADFYGDRKNKIMKNIEDIHPEQVDKQDVSQKIKEGLWDRFDEETSAKDFLYEQANKKIKPTDTMFLDKSGQAASDIEKHLAKVADLSTPSAFVKKKADKFLKAYGDGLDPEQREFSALLDSNSKKIPFIRRDFSPKKIPLTEGVTQRSEWLESLGFDKEALGKKGRLKKMVSGIDEDIDTSASNKDYVKSLRKANEHYRDVYKPLMNDKVFQKLKGKDQEIATQASDYIKDYPSLKKVEKLLKGKKEILQPVKRAKFEEMVLSNITNANGTISDAKLAKFFSGMHKKDDYLKEIAGPTYKSFKNLAKIASAVSGSHEGKNFSNTASSLLDVAKIYDPIIKTINTGRLPIKDIAINAIPNVVSHILSDQKYIDAAVKYATAKRSGNTNAAKHYYKLMGDISKSILKDSKHLTPLIRDKGRKDEG